MNPEALIATYGYIAIFGFLAMGIVLPLIPDETMLVIAGIFIHQSKLAFVPALGAAFLGSLCGITVSYMLGRSGLAHLLHRVASNHLQRVHDWFEKYGRWTLFFGYFVVGVRHVTALVAGTSEMPYPEFARYAYTGAFFWVLTFLSLGYFAGEQWPHIAHLLHQGAGIVAAVVLLCGAAVWFWHRRRSRS
jgi:membrane protein DedA with SNARE-associated domain